jgi:hypothetical protein
VHIQAPTPLTARGSSRCCVRTTRGHGGVRDGGGVCADPDATACVVVRAVPTLSTAPSSDFFSLVAKLKMRLHACLLIHCNARHVRCMSPFLVLTRLR